MVTSTTTFTTPIEAKLKSLAKTVRRYQASAKAVRRRSTSALPPSSPPQRYQAHTGRAMRLAAGTLPVLPLSNVLPSKQRSIVPKAERTPCFDRRADRRSQFGQYTLDAGRSPTVRWTSSIRTFRFCIPARARACATGRWLRPRSPSVSTYRRRKVLAAILNTILNMRAALKAVARKMGPPATYIPGLAE